jgi:hypothetical protein
MEYESAPERLPTDMHKRTGKNIPKEKREKAEQMLKDGQGASAIHRETGLARQTITAVKKDLEDNGGFELGTWKKQTASLYAEIVARGASRLREEICNIPAGQLPLTLAILTDKVMALQDAPAVVVEHRLKVSHDDINQMLKGEIIDLPPAKGLTGDTP